MSGITSLLLLLVNGNTHSVMMRPVVLSLALFVLALSLVSCRPDSLFAEKMTSSARRQVSRMFQSRDPDLSCDQLKPAGRCAPDEYMSNAIMFVTHPGNTTEVDVSASYVFARSLSAPKNLYSVHMYTSLSSQEINLGMSLIADYNIQVAFLYYNDFQQEPRCMSFSTNFIPNMIRNRCLVDDAMCSGFTLGMDDGKLDAKRWAFVRNNSVWHSEKPIMTYTELVVQEKLDYFIPINRFNIHVHEDGRILATEQTTFFNSTLEVPPWMFIVPDECYKSDVSEHLDLSQVNASEEMKRAFMSGLF